MLKTGPSVLMALVLAAGAVGAQDTKTMVAETNAKMAISAASKAIGADVLKTVTYAGSGQDFALGQAANPNAPWPRFIVKSYTRSIDFEAPASRADRIRMQGENPPRGGGLQPVIGEQAQNQTIIVNANTPWVQQLEIVMTPHGFLRAAAARGATAETQTVSGQRFTVVSFTGENKARVNGNLDEQNTVQRVETWIDNALLGDMLVEATYADYKDFGGVKFPTHIVQRQGGYPILDLTITDVKPNAMVDIQPPQGRGGAPGGGGAAPGAQAATPSEKLAEGVFLILGGYASLAVDFKDHIVIIEGPQSEARAMAIIAEAKRLIPNKPIRYVINTHQHIDHASGLRPFAAEGATIVTHQINVPYYSKLFGATRTLNPDLLSKSGRQATFEGVGDRRDFTGGSQVIELHRLQGSGHNDGLLVAYLPGLKLLVEADAYNPPAQPPSAPQSPLSPYVANLVENINRLKLDVERIIPIHYPGDRRVVTRAELMLFAGQTN
jgi:glyoxylase-like metal-dependent hydrolase (beta-lactamase superfamily II)